MARNSTGRTSVSPAPAGPAVETDRTFPRAETLELVADDTRAAILQALFAAEDAPLPFSTLRRRANVERSARFNYHLQRLVGTGVRETDDGYELTPAGHRFVGALFEVPRMAENAGVDHASDD